MGKIKTLLDPRQWPDLALEASYRMRSPVWAGPLSWRVPDDIRSRISLEWPVKYQWSLMSRFGDMFLPAFERFVDVRRVEIPQRHKGNVVVRFIVDGEPLRVAFDVSDYPVLQPQCVDECALTLKLQYRSEGYNDERLVPAGYVPVADLLYRMLPTLRRLRSDRTPGIDVLGRFGLGASVDIRRRAIELLSGTDRFDFLGALRVVRYSRHLRDIAASRVCLDLPGQGPFCFRLVEYMAAGACIVAYRHRARMHVPLIEGTHLVYVEDDMSDLIETCDRLVRDEERARSMGRAAADYFDRYLHREQLTAYYLATVLRYAGGETGGAEVAEQATAEHA